MFKIMRKIGVKIKNMTEVERDCVCMYDEIKLKICVDYNADHDMIEGFKDFGSVGRAEK